MPIIDPKRPRIPLRVDVYNDPQYNCLRRNKMLLFGDIMRNYDIFNTRPYIDKYELIKALEKSCYDAYNACNVSDEAMYHQICYRVATALDPNSAVKSHYLGELILNGGIDISSVGSLNPTELYPMKYDKYKEIHNTAGSGLKTSELYTCFKCKRKQCILENVVNRSIDEGTSLIVHCTFCGNSWAG